MNDKILVSRWPSQWSLMGPPKMVMDVDAAAEALSHSAFMRQWCANKIKEHLLAGETFEHACRTDGDGSWRGRPDGVVAQYRLASDQEIQAAMDQTVISVGTGHAPSKKAQDKGYQLFYMTDAERSSAYALLPFQAKKVLDLLHEHGGKFFTELRVHAIMTEHGAVLKTKQDPMKIFAYYRSTFLKQELLKET